MFREGTQYIRNANNGLRNTDNNLVNMSADICTFNQPTYNLTGGGKIPVSGGKIPVSGVTTADTFVHIITTATTIPVTFNFTGNVESFSSNTAVFKYEIYKHDKTLNQFKEPAIYTAGTFSYSAITGTSAITQNIPVSALTIDGDYLVKGYFKHPYCTKFLGAMGEENDTSTYKKGSSYNLYNPSLDYYFSAFNGAQTPVIGFGPSTDPIIGAVTVRSILITSGDSGTTQVTIPSNAFSEIIVSLNGLTLAPDLDYTLDLTGGTLNLSAETVTNDVITLAYISERELSTGFTTDVISVGVINSGATDTQSSGDTIFYNTSQGKYEIFTELTPTSANDILISLNGVSLANGIDYYQSISNPKRIILNGLILEGDTIVVNYVTSPQIQGELFTNNPIISWTIPNRATDNVSVFTIETSTGSTFDVIASSATTNHVVGQAAYSSSVLVSGDYGQKIYYRVKNNKQYVTVNGDVLNNIAYSETVSVIISTDAINSY